MMVRLSTCFFGLLFGGISFADIAEVGPGGSTWTWPEQQGAFQQQHQNPQFAPQHQQGQFAQPFPNFPPPDFSQNAPHPGAFAHQHPHAFQDLGGLGKLEFPSFEPPSLFGSDSGEADVESIVSQALSQFLDSSESQLKMDKLQARLTESLKTSMTDFFQKSQSKQQPQPSQPQPPQPPPLQQPLQQQPFQQPFQQFGYQQPPNGWLPFPQQGYQYPYPQQPYPYAQPYPPHQQPYQQPFQQQYQQPYQQPFQQPYQQPFQQPFQQPQQQPFQQPYQQPFQQPFQQPQQQPYQPGPNPALFQQYPVDPITGFPYPQQQQQQQQPLRADLNSFGEQLPAFNQPSEVDSTAARLEEAQQRLGRDWDAKYPHGKARELRKLRQEMAKGSEGASEQFSNVIGGAMGGRANPALAQQVLNQQGKPLSAVTDAMKSALSGDPELQQKITQAIGEGKGVEGVVGAVLSGFTEKEGGMQKLMQTVLKSLPADSGVEGMMKQALSSGGGADSMLKTAMASMGGTDGLMKVVMDKMKDSNFNDFVKGAVNVASGAGSESNDPMENFVDQAMGMLGDDVSTNLGGGDQVRKLMSKAMKKVMEGDTGDRLKQVLEGSMKTANSTSNSTKVFASTMDKVANGDMYGIVQGLLGELSDTGVMETMVKEALTAFNGNSDSMTSLIDEALKSSLGDSIPGGPDGVFGKMMKDMAKSMASNPDSLVKIVTQSLKGGTQNGVGGLDIAQMVVKGLSRKLGTPAGSNKGGDDDSGIEGIASRDLIQQYMKKMTDNAKMDPLNNIGQEFMAMMKGVMKDQNLDPEQYGALLKDTLSQDDVKHMIDDALKKNLESGSIEAMVEETLAKEFPFVPIDAVKPIITQLLQSQMQSGSLQGLLSSFVTQQVEAAALGKEAPSVADLQAKLMEEISSVLPAESKKKITNSK